MRRKARIFAPPILASLLCAQSFPAQESGPGTDGHFPAPRTEAAYRFDCGFARVELRWRQENFPLGEPPNFSNSVRVTLLQFSAPGQAVSDADLGRLRRFFDRLAWIDSARPWCYPDSSLRILLIAMPKRRWVSFFERNREGETVPRAQIHMIAISRAGTISIEEPDD